ncbi:MAG TPA: histone deacetylase family protein [Nevskia sp.]|nr:histone deacetylase family protein [Nevskia sp.]
MATLYITHPAYLNHITPLGHPERPDRLKAIDRALEDEKFQTLAREQAPAAPIETIALAHPLDYVEQIRDATPEVGMVRIDADTSMSPGSFEAASRAVGAITLAVDEVMQGKVANAFCAVRPPGHHAERRRAMGFCFFNNIAVAAAHALAQGLERVAILDFDVHYGNGTAEIFAGDPRVVLYSTYEHPLYPYWNGIPGAHNLVDVALPPGAGSEAFRAAVSERWLPAMLEQKPQMILVSAGFDAHVEDPLADLRLGYDDYSWVAARIQEVAEQCCPGRIVAMLEGGYSLHALARSVERFLQPFLSGDMPL